MSAEPFVLDLAENPHPVLLAKALHYRRCARATWSPWRWFFAVGWLFYREAMLDATGWTAETAEAWLDSHEKPLPEALRDHSIVHVGKRKP